MVVRYWNNHYSGVVVNIRVCLSNIKGGARLPFNMHTLSLLVILSSFYSNKDSTSFESSGLNPSNVSSGHLRNNQTTQFDFGRGVLLFLRRQFLYYFSFSKGIRRLLEYLSVTNGVRC